MKQYDLISQIYSGYSNIGIPQAKIANAYLNSGYLQSIKSSPKIDYNNSLYYYYTNSNLTNSQDINYTVSSNNYTGVNSNLSSINNVYPYYVNINSNTSSISNNLYSYVPINNTFYYPNNISSLSNISVTSNPYISSSNSLQQKSLLDIRGSIYNNIGLVNGPYNASYITSQSIPLLVNSPLPVANAGYYIQGQNIQSIPYSESGINSQNIYTNNYPQNFNGNISYYNYVQYKQNSSLKYDTKSYELDDNDELNTSKELNDGDLYVPEPQNTNPNVNVSIPNNNIYQYGSQNVNPTVQAVRLSSASNFNSLNYAQNQNQAILLPNYSSVNSLSNQPIYVQSQNIQPPKITVLPPRIIRPGVPNLLNSPVRMTIRSSSQPSKLRASYSINASNTNQSRRVIFSPIRYSITRPLVLSPMRYSITRPALLSPIRKYNFTSLPLVSIPANKYNFSSVPIMSNPVNRYNITSNSPMNSPSIKYYITSASNLSKPLNYTSVSKVSSPLIQKRSSSPQDAIRSSLRQSQFSSPKIITSPIRENRFLSPHDAGSPIRQSIVYSPPIISSPLRQTNAHHVRNISSPLRQSREIEIARIVTPIRKNKVYKIKTYKVPSLYEKKRKNTKHGY